MNRTNEVRRKHWFQKEVTLEGRNNEATRRRLMKLRNIRKSEKADAKIEMKDISIVPAFKDKEDEKKLAL
ncbi:MAG: hypothetical protein K6E84_04480 [Lachnospiraceae bacterium]|nr:hypothetical protein [Lachnospiraceae bacterium]